MPDFEEYLHEELKEGFQKALWGGGKGPYLPVLKVVAMKTFALCKCCLKPETDVEIDKDSGLCLYCQPCGECGEFGTIDGDRCTKCNWWDPS